MNGPKPTAIGRGREVGWKPPCKRFCLVSKGMAARGLVLYIMRFVPFLWTLTPSSLGRMNAGPERSINGYGGDSSRSGGGFLVPTR
jgi:hypothetical protein